MEYLSNSKIIFVLPYCNLLEFHFILLFSSFSVFQGFSTIYTQLLIEIMGIEQSKLLNSHYTFFNSCKNVVHIVSLSKYGFLWNSITNFPG